MDANGFEENQTAAKKGGRVAGNARKELEVESKEKIVNKENYIDAPEKIKKLVKR